MLKKQFGGYDTIIQLVRKEGIMGGMLKCKKCNKIIHSMYRHDFKTCDCDHDGHFIFVDGGFDYTRVGGYPEDIIWINHIHDETNKNKITIISEKSYNEDD